MPSPFPGMDPYLEQDDVWHEFHERLITVVAEILESQVGPNYIVKIGEHVYVHELPPGERHLLGRSDVFISGPLPGSEKASAAVLDAPVMVRLPDVDRESLSSIEIRDRRSRELVTAIEVLSPTNKRPGPHRQQYLAKRAQILSGASHFVEIDLLRGGQRMPLENPPPLDYYVLVSRVEDRPRGGLWPISLRESFRIVPVPLRAPDRDVILDPRLALNRVYDAAGYAKYIYASEPSPPIGSEDAAWAKAVLEN